MNTAYHNYLSDALDHYFVNTDETEAIDLFLDWLKDYHPKDGAVREPDAYDYAEAAGRHMVGYVDEESLAERGTDPRGLSARDRTELLRDWAERIHDAVFEGPHSDLMGITLADAKDATGLAGD